MASEVSTIQSLKAVDAWIDVINANINGGVRTAFKSSRLKFGGSNVDVTRAGTSTSLPLQFPEPGLTTANSIIDFGQGAITASTENSHLAIQGEGFFLLSDPTGISAAGTWNGLATTRIYISRDGEFRTNAQGFLVNANGLILMCGPDTASGLYPGAQDRAVFNDLDIPAGSATATGAVKLSDYLKQTFVGAISPSGAALGLPATTASLLKIDKGKQSLQYTTYGSTVFDFGYAGAAAFPWSFPSITTAASTPRDATILTKSLEASNSSMTQSVPELSLAQKLFSALTKVLQTKQTNVDGVLNLVR